MRDTEHVITVEQCGQRALHRLANGLGCDAVCFVVRDLLFAPSSGFIHRRRHGVGDPVGVQQHVPIGVPGCAANGLNE